MKTIDLGGKWTVKQADSEKLISALVPGDVYADLLRENEIPDPFFRDNEKQLQWIGETDWTYSREFEISKSLFENDCILLHCDGLDTLANIKLNDQHIADTDNMYRTYEWDVKNILKPGKNKIEIHFSSTIPYSNEKQKKHKLCVWGNTSGFNDDWLLEKQLKVDVAEGWIRKEPANYGWDWGLMALTCGIWRDINIVAFNCARIKDVHVQQQHMKDQVVLTVNNILDKVTDNEVIVKVSVSYENKLIKEKTVSTSKSEIDCEFTISNPELWWPSGMGKQALYNVKVELLNSTDDIIDTSKKNIGIRKVELVRNKDQWGESFYFAVNGVSLFAKGANWIPGDGILANMPDSRYRELIESAVDANMNMLRVWGGGIYEPDIFYNICDELGILIWQDFMFACSTYPVHEKSFLDNVEQEVRDNVKRLRHHPCIALWCGNNELEQGLVGDDWTPRTMPWKEYGNLFDKLIPSLVEELDSETPYWPGSPHTPNGDRKNFNDPTCGDAHLWDVWHAKMPFEWYRTTEHRFVSEFGFQSFPEPKTVDSYTIEEDKSVTSYIMEHHQRTSIGNSSIMFYMLDWFKLPMSFDSSLWLSQILQGLAIKYAVEHWRRNMPKCMGALYWQLNDTWPVASWASIDYFGRWKALHYIAKNFFAPLMISGVEKNESQEVEIHVTSDSLNSTDATANCQITDLSGNVLFTDSTEFKIPIQGNLLIKTVQLSEILKKHGSRNILVWLELEQNGEIVSENMVHFEKPKHMTFQKPEIEFEVIEETENIYSVVFVSEAPALWMWLELKDYDAKYSDNFIHIRPGKNKIVTIAPKENISKSEFTKQLIIKSLIDTY